MSIMYSPPLELLFLLWHFYLILLYVVIFTIVIRQNTYTLILFPFLTKNTFLENQFNELLMYLCGVCIYKDRKLSCDGDGDQESPDSSTLHYMLLAVGGVRCFLWLLSP